MGELPIAKSLGYMEILDDGNETGEVDHNGRKYTTMAGKTIRSIDKHTDYDFTLVESTVVKGGNRKKMRTFRFQFSEDLEEIRIEYTNVNSIFKSPIILYFQERK